MALCCLTSNTCLCGVAVTPTQLTAPWLDLLEGPLLLRHSISTKPRDHYIFQYQRWVLLKKKKKGPVLSSLPFLRVGKPTVPHPAFFSHYSEGFITHFPTHCCEELMVSRHSSHPSLLLCNTNLRSRNAHHSSDNLVTPIPFLLQFHWFSGIHLTNIEVSLGVAVQV